MRHLLKPFFVLLLLLLQTGLLTAEDAKQGALFDYVAKEDDSYGWKVRQTTKLGGVDVTELTLTSQTWRGIVWKHQLYIMKPEGLKDASQALMIISGGGWSDDLEKPAEGKMKLPSEASILSGVVKRINTPVAILMHVPQQPIFDGKTEDAIISYTFDEYLKSGDPEWPLLLPMTKSAVRAMDAIQEYARQDWSMDIDGFTVTGGSKRGWTTWLTGAVDPRATTIAPMVIDVLNMEAQMKHQLEAWGEYSVMIRDYTERGIQSHSNTDAGKKLMQIVDPYSYRQHVTQPKLLVIGTNDPYWPLDALDLYWNDLLGEKRILYVPNKGHGVDDFRRLIGTISALHLQASGRHTLPDLSWELEEADGKLIMTVQSDQKPEKVSAWIADAETRDFRKSTWKASPTEESGDGYRYELPIPAKGYAAMFGEAEFKVEGLTYFLSTNVKIVQAEDGAEDAAKDEAKKN